MEELLKSIKLNKKLICHDIEELKEKLKDLEVKEKLLESNPPVIVFSDNRVGKYRFISEPVVLEDLQLILYPIWIDLECIYPRWTTDFLAVSIVDYMHFKTGKGYECLIDGLVNGLACSYTTARKLIIEHELTVPITFTYNCVVGSNMNIDFSTNMEISDIELNKHRYQFRSSSDSDMVSNTMRVKYILILPQKYYEKFNNFD